MECPTCNYQLLFPASERIDSIKCPECGEVVRIPKAKPAPQPKPVPKPPPPPTPRETWEERKEKLERELLINSAYNHRVIAGLLHLILGAIALMVVATVAAVVIATIAGLWLNRGK